MLKHGLWCELCAAENAAFGRSGPRKEHRGWGVCSVGDAVGGWLEDLQHLLKGLFANRPPQMNGVESVPVHRGAQERYPGVICELLQSGREFFSEGYDVVEVERAAGEEQSASDLKANGSEVFQGGQWGQCDDEARFRLPSPESFEAGLNGCDDLLRLEAVDDVVADIGEQDVGGVGGVRKAIPELAVED